ncbi:tRNA A-37 threonylcarbamoyl transferase component Bud32 [Parelusimicrobium proximum]|uniref:phosphotransferase family protein n=1 Tax=Parelusimicrobium proximum TaxID=3228953 RepID=UPI003D1761D5
MKLDNVIAARAHKKVYRDGDKAIKVFDKDFSKSDVLNEALNQSRVEETGLRIPKILEVTKINDSWAIVTQFIDGPTLAELMEKSPSKFDEYLKTFIELQMSVHEKRAPLLNKLKDKMQRKISETDLSATIRYELHTRLDSMPKHVSVCHGDFNPSNIIMASDGAYIIDWSHATQGDGAADAARTYLLFLLYGKKEAAEKYIDLFCEKTDTPKQLVQKWIPIVAASQSVKGRKEEREFLLGLVDIFDFQ